MKIKKKCVSYTKRDNKLYLWTKDPINSVQFETSGAVCCFILSTTVENLLNSPPFYTVTNQSPDKGFSIVFYFFTYSSFMWALSIFPMMAI